MIDLHSHILPGVDDGPPTVEGSLELARAAVAAGTRTILATPHINDDRSIDATRVAEGLEALRPELAAADIPLEVLPGWVAKLAAVMPTWPPSVSRAWVPVRIRSYSSFFNAAASTWLAICGS